MIRNPSFHADLDCLHLQPVVPAVVRRDFSGAYTYTFGYAYDKVGNRTAMTNTITSTLVTTYTYDAANRLATQNGQSIFTWDANGNLLQDGSMVYAYDFANRLISTTLSGVNTQFGYNGDGIRLRLIEAGTLTTYTQDYAAPLPVVLQAKMGTASTQYVYSLGTRPLAEYEAAAWEYLLPDPLGSVRQIADPSGNVTLLKSYEPYGSLLNSQGSAASVFAYAGEQIDGTGLIYLRARYMQSRLGIFLSRDAWTGDENRPLTFNGFVYAHANPVNLTDRSGLCVGLCVPGRLAYVKNAPAGLSLRTTPNRSSDINLIQRFKNGTPVNIKHGGPRYLDDAVWYPVTVAGLTGYEGWMAERDLRGGDTEHLTHVPPTPAPPPGGVSPPPSADAKWVSPFGEEAPRFGFLFEWDAVNNPNGHDGVDMVSASDTEVTCYRGQGCSITGSPCDEKSDSRKVFAVGTGKVEWADPTPGVRPGLSRNTGLMNFVLEDGSGTVQYTHVWLADDISIGQTYSAGKHLGWYGPYGEYRGVPHLHLSLLIGGVPQDPLPYLQ